VIALECSRIADARRCPPWSETAEPYGSSMKSSRRYLAVVALLMTVTTAHTSQIAGKTLVAKVDAYLAPYVEGRNFSGAILIAEGGCVLFTKGVTAWRITNWQCRNRSDTRFHIASISKSFTAAAILMLQERGQLHMQDTLAKFIPDYPQGDKITLHHLLTHTSGIPNVNNLPTYSEKSLLCLNLTQIIPLFEDKPLEFQPGAFSLLQFQLQPARLYHRESLWERLWKVPRGKYLSASRNECHGQRRRIERPDSEPRFRICASRHAGCRKHPISELVDQDR